MTTEIATEPLLLCRQPIVDRNGRMFGFELLFRAQEARRHTTENGVSATSQVLYDAFAELGIDSALGPYRGFVNCDAQVLLQSDIIDALPPRRVVLEVLETVEPTPDILDRLDELRQAGYTLALDDYAGEAEGRIELLQRVDIVKVDIDQVDQSRLESIATSLRGFPSKLLAEKVETHEQAQRCREVGFDLFQGFFFARPRVIAGRKLTVSQLASLRVLNLLLQDVDTGELVDELKRQPGLTVNILRIANAAAVSPGREVGSVLQAVLALGRKQLQRWLQLLLYTDPGSGQRASPLLLVAATRGRVMEQLAEHLWPARRHEAEQAFLVGMLSLLPTLFGMEMPEILRTLPLPREVAAAVLNRRGELGELLAHVTALEAAPETAGDIGVDPQIFNRIVAESMAWANTIA